MSMRHNSVRGRSDIFYYFRPQIPSTKSIVFLLIIFVIFFILYQLLYIQNVTGRVPINVNNTISNKPRITYTYIYHDELVAEYEQNIIDKGQSPSTCLIIVRSTDGGIGNRMFLFASAYGLARLHQCDLYVAPWIIRDLRSIFIINLNNTPVHLITNDSVVNQTGIMERYSACTLYDDLFKVPLSQNLTKYEMIGFYQAYGYFVKYKHEIAYLYQINQASIKRNIALVDQLMKAVWNIALNLGNYTELNVTHKYLKNCLTRPPAPLIPVTWIGIHIRRGDFLTFFKIDTSVEYLTLAMNYYRRKYINCRFLIASDDKEYVKKHLGNNTDIFITPESFFSGEDLAALTLCEHTIVTAGSYGWWIGWLTGGDVVHDLNYPVPFQNCPREHYFPPWFLFPHNSSSPRESMS